MNKTKIDECVKARSRRAPLDEIAKLIKNSSFFYLAGSCLNKDEPNDFDVFPFDVAFDFNDITKKSEENNFSVLNETANALTVKIEDKIIQFCNYKKDSLKELVGSFDFSNCQVGIKISKVGLTTSIVGLTTSIEEVFYTEEWLECWITGEAVYTGSEYPLSSLVRAAKYLQRGLIPKKNYRLIILEILDDLLKRGFKNYDDYKDQLVSIDLVVFGSYEKNPARNLYDTLVELGLVQEPEIPADEEEL